MKIIVEVLSTHHNEGTLYKAGDKREVTEDIAKQLIASSLVKLPKEKKEVKETATPIDSLTSKDHIVFYEKVERVAKVEKKDIKKP